MNGLLVGGRFIDQGFTRAPGDGLIGRIDVGRCPGFGVDDPEDLLDRVRHLVEFLFPVFKHGLCVAFGPVHLTENVGQQERKNQHGSD